MGVLVLRHREQQTLVLCVEQWCLHLLGAQSLRGWGQSLCETRGLIKVKRSLIPRSPSEGPRNCAGGNMRADSDQAVLAFTVGVQPNRTTRVPRGRPTWLLRLGPGRSHFCAPCVYHGAECIVEAQEILTSFLSPRVNRC